MRGKFHSIILFETDVVSGDMIKKEVKVKMGTVQNGIDILDRNQWKNEIIFCDERDLSPILFRKNMSLVEAIENMEVLMVVIGKSIDFKWTPINVQRIKKDDNIKKNVAKLIDKWLIIIDKINQREKVIANKLNRLFYILHEFETKDDIYMKDIIKVTGVSKRTVQRDFQLIKEMLINKDIVFDENNGTYTMYGII